MVRLYPWDLKYISKVTSEEKVHKQSGSWNDKLDHMKLKRETRIWKKVLFSCVASKSSG